VNHADFGNYLLGASHLCDPIPTVLLTNRTKCGDRKNGNQQRTAAMISITRTFILAFIALAFLSACGGGGGGANPPPPPVDTTLTWDDDNWDEKDWQ